jgi:hypothetical protein
MDGTKGVPIPALRPYVLSFEDYCRRVLDDRTGQPDAPEYDKRLNRQLRCLASGLADVVERKWDRSPTAYFDMSAQVSNSDHSMVGRKGA